MTGGLAAVTGASGGIGRALALGLAQQGHRLLLTGRNTERLGRVAAEVAARGAQPSVVEADLSTDEGIARLAAVVEGCGRLDVLVHCAGVLRLGAVLELGAEDLDLMYRVNARAPYLLTRRLLPMLEATRGQVVFVNTWAALEAGDANACYAATKRAQATIAGSIRNSVNAAGVRVVCVFPGRTATAMQERVHAYEGKRYDPARLLQPGDVADTVVHALALPRTAEVTDIVMRPMASPSDTGSTQ